MKCLIIALLSAPALAFAAQSVSDLAAAVVNIDKAISADRQTQAAGMAKHQNPAIPEVPPRVGDAAFLRRACIDLAGRLPLPDEVRTFLADTRADKRTALIDRLVVEPGASELRFRRLAEMLRVKDNVGKQSQAAFIQWLREAVAADMPYDQLVTAMIRAEGSVGENPAAGFMQRNEGDWPHTATDVAQIFLSEDLNCARCHDHAYADWTQSQVYEFASCFAAPVPSAMPAPTLQPRPLVPGARPVGGRNSLISVTPSGAVGLRLPWNYKYRNGTPGERVQPRYLKIGHTPFDDYNRLFGEGPSTRDAAQMHSDVAVWLTDSHHPRFAQVAAARVWEGLLGDLSAQGKVYSEGRAPEESFHQDTKQEGYGQCCSTMGGVGMEGSWGGVGWPEIPSATRLALGKEFIRCGHRLREFQRIIARTQAYQREVFTRGYGLPYDFALGAPLLRRVPAEVLWDAWAGWLPKGHASAQTSADLPQVPPDEHPLRLLGRASREWADQSEAPLTHALARFIMNSPLIADVSASPALLSTAARPESKVEQLFLTTLNRFPQPTEQAAALRHLAENPTTGTQDIAWALLNTTEFLFHP